MFLFQVSKQMKVAASEYNPILAPSKYAYYPEGSPEVRYITAPGVLIRSDVPFSAKMGGESVSIKNAVVLSDTSQASKFLLLIKPEGRDAYHVVDTIRIGNTSWDPIVKSTTYVYHPSLSSTETRQITAPAVAIKKDGTGPITVNVAGGVVFPDNVLFVQDSTRQLNFLPLFKIPSREAYDVADSVRVNAGEPTAVEEGRGRRPVSFELSQNFPNPFNPKTTINFRLEHPTNVSLKVYDVQGKEVATLADGRMKSGEHSIKYDASGLSSGIYLVRLETPEGAQTKKITLLK